MKKQCPGALEPASIRIQIFRSVRAIDFPSHIANNETGRHTQGEISTFISL